MTRTLHIYRDTILSHRHITVKDSDKTTPLYIVSSHTGLSGRANLEIFVPSASPSPQSASPGTKIADIDFHSFSSRITILLHGTPLELHRKNLFSRSRVFESASGLGTLVWKVERWTRGMSLVDGLGRIVARLQGHFLAMRKQAVLEVMVGKGGGEEGRVVDEVVVSALAMVEAERRRRSAGAGGGGGGAGGGGC
ncbi:hypothetical protein G7Y79_00057g090830 [Physcia stellaris]|nr:hypothetical protein G7Y79_00057g090830 [Physcia stellaris]